MTTVLCWILEDQILSPVDEWCLGKYMIYAQSTSCKIMGKGELEAVYIQKDPSVFNTGLLLELEKEMRCYEVETKRALYSLRASGREMEHGILQRAQLQLGCTLLAGLKEDKSGERGAEVRKGMASVRVPRQWALVWEQMRIPWSSVCSRLLGN